MRRIRKTCYVLSALLMAVCVSVFALMTVEAAGSRAHLEEFLANVNANDGIDAFEAEQMAWAYFLGFVSGCGGPDDGRLVGDEWVIPASFGYAGQPMAVPIRINAKTGAISQLGGKSFHSYSAFRLYLLWGIPIRKLESHLEDFYLEHLSSAGEDHA